MGSRQKINTVLVVYGFVIPKNMVVDPQQNIHCNYNNIL